WMLFLPRRWRIACFFVVTAWQIPVILTANYTFLNYLVLLLGVLLLDDRCLMRRLPRSLQQRLGRGSAVNVEQQPELAGLQAWRDQRFRAFDALRLGVASVLLSLIFYSTTVQMIWIVAPGLPLPLSPVAALEPFRIANRYGLFAVMTRGRYEIEFQGSNDGATWAAYPFRYKPQDLTEPPGIYAPYQPRFEWNLWFASLDHWRENMFVVSTEERLLAGGRDVLGLFGTNPFPSAPPKYVRAVLWQYWFTSLSEKRESGRWWRRGYRGLYAPTLTVQSGGQPAVVEWPSPTQPGRE
ncbi:MAG TPA: lipase maturation factor family protein, partial [Candidatus Angelobacter sp.]|nr:lipase maturation factor family protein [Candidatus Angelobacter sp.]